MNDSQKDALASQASKSLARLILPKSKTTGMNKRHHLEGNCFNGPEGFPRQQSAVPLKVPVGSSMVEPLVSALESL